MGERILVVEGNSDRAFFKAYCDAIGKAEIKVRTPVEAAQPERVGNGWRGVVDALPKLLMQIKAENIDQLGIVVDADYPQNEGGFAQRCQQLLTAINDAANQVGVGHYCLSPTPSSGAIFQHENGLPEIGLWVMPSHQDDGMLEDFIQRLIVDPIQSDLLNHAKQSIAVLPTVLFNRDLHLAKATVSTWRAWQKEPSASLGQALNNKLLDRSKAVDFENWLRKVFP